MSLDKSINGRACKQFIFSLVIKKLMPQGLYFLLVLGVLDS